VVDKRRDMGRDTFRSESFTALNKEEANDTARLFCAEENLRRIQKGTKNEGEYFGNGLAIEDAKGLTALKAYYPSCQRTLAAQVKHININTKNKPYDLVVLTIGGNDAFFSDIAAKCLVDYDKAIKKLEGLIIKAAIIPGFIFPAEISLITSEIARYKLAKKSTKDCASSLQKANDVVFGNGDPIHDRNVVRSRLARVLREVDLELNKERRENPAQILLLSYPYLINNHDYKNYGLRIGEKVKQILDEADNIQRSVVSAFNQKTRVPGSSCMRESAIFADGTKIMFNTHGVDAPVGLFKNKDIWWIWGALEAPIPLLSDSFHPKPEGHEAMAEVALKSLKNSGTFCY
jgi:lysophospholipase L1-like esterase